MSNLTLDHPTTSYLAPRPSVRTARQPVVPGSYVDTDGAHRAPRVLASYVGHTSFSGVGSYTDRDGVRALTGCGSYTRVER